MTISYSPQPTLGQWVVPEVIVPLNHFELLWSGHTELTSSGMVRGTSVTAPEDLLERFLNLDLDKPEHIIRFARKFGVFGRDFGDDRVESQIELPVWEWPDDWHRAFLGDGYEPTEVGSYYYLDRQRRSGVTDGYRKGGVSVQAATLERTSEWSLWRRTARALLNISSELHKPNGSGKNEDWITLVPMIPAYDSDRLDIVREQGAGWGEAHARYFDWSAKGQRTQSEARVYQAEWVAKIVTQWLHLAGAGLTFTWGPGGPAIGEGGGGLFGALGIQLMHAVTRSVGIYVCSGCTKTYFREQRRPKPGEKNWCSDCQPYKRSARASQDYRDRLKQRK